MMAIFRRTSVIVPLLLIALALLLWLPFGFASGVTGDAWTYFMQTDQGNIFAHASPLRLFIPVPWLAAHLLSPGTFHGINLVTLLLMVGKSWLLFLILRRLTAHERFAFASAILYLVLPVDTGIFYLGALAVHFTVFCSLLALYYLLEYWRRRFWLLLPVMFFAQLFAVGVYEPAYFFMAAAPALLLLWEKRVTRRLIRVTLVWYLVPALHALWYGYIVLNYPGALRYQADVAQVDRSVGVMLTSVFNIYRRHFFDGWQVGSFDYLPLALIAGALVIAAFWWARPGGDKLSLRWALVGLLVIALGVLLYLPTSLRDVTLRTYFFSGIGAAVVIAALLAQARWSVPLGVALLTVIGGASLLDQHRLYVDESEGQQAILTEIADALPGLTPGTDVVFYDRTGELAAKIGALYMEYMIPALYGDYSLTGTLCLPEEVGETARCRFDENGFSAVGTRLRVNAPYSDLVLVDHTLDGFVVLPALTGFPDYAPLERITPAHPSMAARLAGMFGIDD